MQPTEHTGPRTDTIRHEDDDMRHADAANGEPHALDDSGQAEPEHKPDDHRTGEDQAEHNQDDESPA